MYLILSLFLTLAPLLPGSSRPSALLWSADGHRLVCEIAWRHLTAEARTFVQTVRQGESGTFAESCTWADDVRPDRPETAPLHFINIKPGAAAVDLRRDCPDQRCVVWAIRHYTRLLANDSTNATARSEALKFVGHFVGDLHQPLHAGRLEDRGGNNINVVFLGDRGSAQNPMQLHRVWDSMILRRAGLTYPASVEDLIRRLGTAEAVQWANYDVILWTNESHRLNQEFVYSVRHGGEIGEVYYEKAVGIVKQRILQAAVRLAFLLNEAARGRAHFTF